MNPNQTKELIKHLVRLSRELARGQYGDAGALFELTKRTGVYPAEISELAESFGLMLVKVEARELYSRKLLEQIEKARADLELARQRLARENVGLRRSLGRHFSPKRIIGQSLPMQELLATVERIADTPVNVLITGETGTGKELVARSLHYNSARSDQPFIPLNCTAIPETLFESELFGIEKGVATGIDRRAGRIEQASGGTLFLDEIGDMPLSCQAKILRVLEDRQVVRVGGSKPNPVDIRIVTATNRDLKKEVEDGHFRGDLYYRIKVVHLHIPPLRERTDDIPLLFKSFLEIHCRKMGRGPMKLSPEALQCLTRYPWPGNVRELENEAERIVAIAPSDVVSRENLTTEIAFPEHGNAHGESASRGTLHDAENQVIRKVLSEVRGNKSKAARRLGISREGLRQKLKRFEDAQTS